METEKNPFPEFKKLSHQVPDGFFENLGNELKEIPRRETRIKWLSFGSIGGMAAAVAVLIGLQLGNISSQPQSELVYSYLQSEGVYDLDSELIEAAYSDQMDPEDLGYEGYFLEIDTEDIMDELNP